MDNLTERLRSELISLGADVVGFGRLDVLPPEVRYGMPIGISVVVAYPKDVIRGISELPTRAYYEHYCSLNERLDRIVSCGVAFIHEMGYSAVAQTREQVGTGEDNDNTLLPHKTVAMRAGLGWIGKNALFVTSEYGSAIRLSSIITNAPLEINEMILTSRCGSCLKCKNACPANAITGKTWTANLPRDAFFDTVACRKIARERTLRGVGISDVTICGKCIEVCPFTQRFISN